jgi:hypothetical protein
VSERRERTGTTGVRIPRRPLFCEERTNSTRAAAVETQRRGERGPDERQGYHRASGEGRTGAGVASPVGLSGEPTPGERRQAGDEKRPPSEGRHAGSRVRTGICFVRPRGPAQILRSILNSDRPESCSKPSDS